MRMHPLQHLEGIRREAARGVLCAAVLAVAVPAGLALQDRTAWTWLVVAGVALAVYGEIERALGLEPDDVEVDAADVEAAQERAVDAEQVAAQLCGELEHERAARLRAEEAQAWAEVAVANLADLTDDLVADLSAAGAAETEEVDR
ncbi:hypothetical protein HNR25_005181 [Streptomonospora salina]|uniref:Uncharacterized protein n=1 Tax=Streptomonospora salina TaxID=104205 RepID=A0A841EM11_9ACTN|nr:hypothetical protein [Streptomonospora salina]MBB6001350.1 hypothetical protein [Streptomonospora salina]